MAGIGREIAVNPDNRSAMRIAMDKALEKYSNSGFGVSGNPAQQSGSVGDYITRQITGEPGPGLRETLGLPDSASGVARDLLGIAQPPAPAPDAKGTASPSLVATPAPNATPAGGVGTPKPTATFTGAPTAQSRSDLEFQQAQGVGAGSPYYDRTQDKNNNVTLTPKGEAGAPARDYMKEIDDMVEQITATSKSNHGGKLGIAGASQIVELKKAQLGLVGHQMTAEASREVAAQSSKDRDELGRERLAETTRANKEREAHTAAQLKVMEQSGQDTRELRGQADFEKQLNTYGLDKNTGEYNPNLALFRMAREQKPIPAAYAAAVERVSAPARAHIAKLRAAGRNVTPADEDTIMANYELKLSAPQK